MSHSAVQLTGNCAVAFFLIISAFYRSITDAETKNGHIAGVTGERLNCGRGDNKETVTKNVLKSHGSNPCMTYM